MVVLKSINEHICNKITPMLLEKDDLLLMFKNLQYTIVDLKGLGNVVEISSYDAFDFSSITD